MKLGGHKKPGESKLGKDKKSEKEKINQHEEDLAEKLDGRRQLQSGAMSHAKGDIKLDKFLLDSKETKASSILVVGKDLTKITREANGESKYPGLILTIEQIPDTVEKEWVLIPINVFGELLGIS